MAIDDFDSADAAYFGFGPDARKGREIVIPLSMGGDVSLFPEMDMDTARDDALKLAERVFNQLHDAAERTANVAPDLHRDTLAAIGEAWARDRQAIDDAISAELAKQEAAGMRSVKERYDAANDAEIEALSTLCALPCLSPFDAAAKGAYLAKFVKTNGDAIDWRHWLALAVSITGKDGSGAFEAE